VGGFLSDSPRSDPLYLQNPVAFEICILQLTSADGGRTGMSACGNNETHLIEPRLWQNATEARQHLRVCAAAAQRVAIAARCIAPTAARGAKAAA
jgi:hypothetical protein